MQKKATPDRAHAWLDRSPTHLLHRVSQCAEEIFRAQMQENELTPRQLAVLGAVAEKAGLNQTDIVERTGIDRSTLTDVMRRLSRKGLLERRRTKQDARAYAVELTYAGRRVLRAAVPLAEKIDQQIMAVLSPDERDIFIRLVQSVIAALPKHE
jgi:DNA-binding MarR family transcriptional regulator